jgi:hypothetical protein
MILSGCRILLCDERRIRWWVGIDVVVGGRATFDRQIAAVGVVARLPARNQAARAHLAGQKALQ